MLEDIIETGMLVATLLGVILVIIGLIGLIGIGVVTLSKEIIALLKKEEEND
jgi:hypothetical protein